MTGYSYPPSKNQKKCVIPQNALFAFGKMRVYAESGLFFGRWMPAFAGMTPKIWIILALLFLGWTDAAHAVRPDEVLHDPVLEARARDISKELRCLVCQNESIDDSDAPLAHDLRVLLRQRLTVGDTDEAARQYIVARYGDYVLLKPPFKQSTFALWLGPFLLFIAATGGTALFYRRSMEKEVPLTGEERKKLLALMESEEEEDEK